MPTTTTPPSVQILALGMPRTGTMSMKLALEHLGYGPVYHGLDIFQRPQDSVTWTDLLEKKHFGRQKLSRADLDRLFDGYAVVTDLCFLVWVDLLDAYPDVNSLTQLHRTQRTPPPKKTEMPQLNPPSQAKLLLIQRDVDSWYHSYNKTLMPGLFTLKARLYKTLCEPLLNTQFIRMGEMMQLSFFASTSQSDFRANAREKYRDYYCDVRAAARARGRPVLEFGLGEGWGPLCQFLGREVPEGKEFPRANEEKVILEFWRRERRRRWWGVGVVVVWDLLVPLFVVAGLVVLCFMAR